MKKLFAGIILISILISGYIVYNYFQIKPWEIKDIVIVTSTNTNGRMLFALEENISNARDVGYFNWEQGELWKDENKYIDQTKRPLIIAVSTQYGNVSEQVVTVTDEKKTLDVYLPAVQKEGGDDGLWAWFYIDTEGSSYWGCSETRTCNGGIIGTERALQKQNIARSALHR